MPQFWSMQLGLILKCPDSLKVLSTCSFPPGPLITFSGWAQEVSFENIGLGSYSVARAAVKIPF